MLTIGRPVLVAGATALALAPLLLHLFARRPPPRMPMPTARFMTPGASKQLRVTSVPRDRALMALRMGTILLLGVALAEPRWVPASAGTAVVVLVDGGAGMASSWSEALDSAFARIDNGAEILSVFGAGRASFANAELTPARRDSLRAAGPVAEESDYLEALRELRSSARSLVGADSIEAVLVTRPRWEAWTPGWATVRDAGWPGGLELVAVGAGPPLNPGGAAGEDVGAETASRARRGAVLLAAREEGSESGEVARALAIALQVGGWSVVGLPTPVEGQDGTEGADADAVERWLTDAPSGAFMVAVDLDSPALLSKAVTRVRAGDTLVLAGTLPGVGPEGVLPWNPSPIDPPAGISGILVGDELVGWGTQVSPGGPVERAAVPLVRADGRPAAAALRVGEGCVVYLAAPLGHPSILESPTVPALLERLVAGCGPPTRSGVATGALDPVARAWIEGSRGPVSRVSLGAPVGRRLEPWSLVLLLVALLLEAWLATGRADSTGIGLGPGARSSDNPALRGGLAEGGS